VKIDFWQLQVQPWPLYAMPQVNLPSSIAVREISESALLSLNVYQVFGILFQLVHR
jgi:hypothetical protein